MHEGHSPDEQAGWHVQLSGGSSSLLYRLSSPLCYGCLGQTGSVKVKPQGKARSVKTTGKGEKKGAPGEWGHPPKDRVWDPEGQSVLDLDRPAGCWQNNR